MIKRVEQSDAVIFGKTFKVKRGTKILVKGKLSIESIDALIRCGFTIVYK